MMNTTTISVKQQSLSHDSINHVTESSSQDFFKVLDDAELELEDILIKEFEQGLPADIAPGL